MGSINIGPEHRLETITNLASPGAVGYYRAGVLTVEGVSDADLALAVTNYFADEETHILQPEREKAAEQISRQCWEFFQNRYSTQVVQTFQGLISAALVGGNVPQQHYCLQLQIFGEQVATASLQAIELLASETTVEGIQNVAVDFSFLETLDPGVSLESAIALGHS